MITIYTIQDCPNCENIKSKLTAAGYEFREEDMCTPENITELRSNGCFAMEAPVLRVDDTFYEYCACSQAGFFSELFGVRPDQQEVPQHDGRMEMPFQDEVKELRKEYHIETKVE